MIELRIVRRTSHDSRESHIDVLQQRTKTRHRESSTTTALPLGWTDWTDVPIVKEDT